MMGERTEAGDYFNEAAPRHTAHGLLTLIKSMAAGRVSMDGRFRVGVAEAGASLQR